MNLFTARLLNRWTRYRQNQKDLSLAVMGNIRALDGIRPKDPARSHRFVVVDLETTGLDKKRDRVVSVGAFRVVEGRIKLDEVFDELVNPGRRIPEESIRVHAIMPDTIRNARLAWEVFDDFLGFIGGDILVAHHAWFDMYFLNRVMRAQHGFRLQNLVVDTVMLCRNILLEADPYGQRLGARRCSLEELAKHYGLETYERHTALGDALVTALVFQRLLCDMERAGWSSLRDLVRLAGMW